MPQTFCALELNLKKKIFKKRKKLFIFVYYSIRRLEYFNLAVWTIPVLIQNFKGIQVIKFNKNKLFLKKKRKRQKNWKSKSFQSFLFVVFLSVR